VLTRSAQLRYLQRALFHYAEPPNATNLSAAGIYCGGDVLERGWGGKLRWATLGNDYDWTTKLYADRAGRPLPRELSRLAKLIITLLGTEVSGVGLEPDAAIVNYYPSNGRLAPHVDRSERLLDRPLVTLSLGQSAIYLTGGQSVDDMNVDAILLHSGDVLVMAGKQRLVYHAISKIVQGASFAAKDDNEIAESVINYANTHRVSITIRQVDN
jgi:alkylated DNA repair protein alkB family protein 1